MTLLETRPEIAIPTDESLRSIGPSLVQEEYATQYALEDYQVDRYYRLLELVRTGTYEGIDLPDLIAAKLNSLHNTRRMPEIKNNIAYMNLIHKSSQVLGNRITRPTFYWLTATNKLLIESSKTILSKDTSRDVLEHDEMREEIDVNKRINEAWILRSGHLGKIFLGGQTIRAGLIDAVRSEQLNGERELKPRNNPEFTIAMTLLAHDIIPFTTDGFVVALDALTLATS